MHQMFYITPSFNQPGVANWDTSNVGDISRMFGAARLFDGPIGKWDTGRVTDMSNVFLAARNFNHPIGYWDTSRVKTMYGLFIQANAFDQDLSSWNTSAVQSMQYTFRNAYSFDQPLESWDVSSVTNMVSMFAGATMFDRPLESSVGSSSASSSNSLTGGKNHNKDERETNNNANNVNANNGYWDISSVTSMKRMFSMAFSFNQCLASWASVLSSHENVTEESSPTFRMFENTPCPNHKKRVDVDDDDDDNDNDNDNGVDSNNGNATEPVVDDGTPPFDRGPWCQGPSDGCFEVELTPYTTPEGTIAYARSSRVEVTATPGRASAATAKNRGSEKNRSGDKRGRNYYKSEKSGKSGKSNKSGKSGKSSKRRGRNLRSSP